MIIVIYPSLSTVAITFYGNIILANKTYSITYIAFVIFICILYTFSRIINKKNSDKEQKEKDDLRLDNSNLKNKLDEAKTALNKEKDANKAFLNLHHSIQTNLLDKFDSQHLEYLSCRLNNRLEGDAKKHRFYEQEAFEIICNLSHEFLVFYTAIENNPSVQVCILSRQKKSVIQKNKPIWTKIVGQHTNFNMNVFNDNPECYKNIVKNGKVMMTKEDAYKKKYYKKNSTDVVENEKLIGTIIYQRIVIKHNNKEVHEYLLVGDVFGHEIDFSSSNTAHLFAFFDKAARKIQIYGTVKYEGA